MFSCYNVLWYYFCSHTWVCTLLIICVSYIHVLLDNFVCMDDFLCLCICCIVLFIFVPYFDMLVDLKCRHVTIFMRWFWFVILHSIFVMIFGIRHWYILAYLCMYLYWLGTFIIYVHFDKCKCTIWLWIETVWTWYF